MSNYILSLTHTYTYLKKTFHDSFANWCDTCCLKQRESFLINAPEGVLQGCFMCLQNSSFKMRSWASFNSTFTTPVDTLENGAARWLALLSHSRNVLRWGLSVLACLPCTFSLCTCGFSPFTLTSSHSPKTEVLIK